MSNKREEIILLAIQLGFNRVRVAKVERGWYSKWFLSFFGISCDYGVDGSISSSSKNPYLLLPDAKSILTLGIDYRWNYSSGAYIPFWKGSDVCLGKRLPQGTSAFEKTIGWIRKIWWCSRIWGVDSRPFIERSWAESGLGYIGKNTMLISPETLHFLLGNVDVEYWSKQDEPLMRSLWKMCCCQQMSNQCLWMPINSILESAFSISQLNIKEAFLISFVLDWELAIWLWCLSRCMPIMVKLWLKWKFTRSCSKTKQPFVDSQWLKVHKVVDDYLPTPLRKDRPDNSKDACIVAGNIGDGKLQASLNVFVPQEYLVGWTCELGFERIFVRMLVTIDFALAWWYINN